MTNHIILVIGCILVAVGYYRLLPVEYGSVFNIIGIISLIYGVVWDY